MEAQGITTNNLYFKLKTILAFVSKLNTQFIIIAIRKIQRVQTKDSEL